jgi:hypothetical protein
MCPAYFEEANFWRIYFVLLLGSVDRSTSAALATDQVSLIE